MVHEFAGGNRSEFARKVGGVTSTAVGDTINKNATPNGDILARIVVAYPVNSLWLLTGEGPMKRRDPSKMEELIQKVALGIEDLD